MSKEQGSPAMAVMPTINVTPLIDVLLVLLIIFVAITPLKPSRFKAMIPEPPLKEDIPPNPLTLVVTIDKDMQLKLNQIEGMGTVNDMTKLSEKLMKVFRERGENHVYEKTVFIKAPRALQYGEVVKVIDGIKMAGGEPIGLQIDDLN